MFDKFILRLIIEIMKIWNTIGKALHFNNYRISE